MIAPNFVASWALVGQLLGAGDPLSSHYLDVQSRGKAGLDIEISAPEGWSPTVARCPGPWLAARPALLAHASCLR